MEPTSESAHCTGPGRQKSRRLSQQMQVLAERLPDMIARATADYEYIASWERAEDAKSAAAHQAALRAALAHLEALLGLARRLDEPGTSPSRQDDGDFLAQLFNEAAAAVAMLPDESQE